MDDELQPFTKGFEGVDTAGDLGWKWGTESIGQSLGVGYGDLRNMLKDAGLKLSAQDWEDFKDQYYEARKGW